MPDNDKRSSDNEMGTPGHDVLANEVGVGARHKESQPPADVGGYLDICNKSGFDLLESTRKNDPRMKELIDVGVNGVWLEIAYDLGFDSFMIIWKRFNDTGLDRIKIPKITRFKNLKRNNIMKNCFKNRGMQTNQVQRYIKKMLCEDLSTRHIDRLKSKSKVDK